MDETGHVTFIARKEEQMTFKHGGDKIYPKQITDVASTHPNIIEYAVSGIKICFTSTTHKSLLSCRSTVSELVG